VNVVRSCMRTCTANELSTDICVAINSVLCVCSLGVVMVELLMGTVTTVG
jgi:hypothetical protein